jgi:hypothetical protein
MPQRALRRGDIVLAVRRIVFAILLVSSRAWADGFAELDGALAIPLANKDWTNAVDTSLSLGARAGGGGPVGGIFMFDWAPLSSNVAATDLNRFRIQGGVYIQNRVAPKVAIRGRFTAGIDIIHSHTEIDIPIVGRVSGSDTDVGLALEPGGGAWFDLGSVKLGVELGLPISYHSKKGNPNNPANDAKYDYTSVDLTIVGGVRFGI